MSRADPIETRRVSETGFFLTVICTSIPVSILSSPALTPRLSVIMAIPGSLPEKNVVIRFPPSSTAVAEESYKLLELPAEILKQVESSRQPLPYVVHIRYIHR